MNEAVIDLPRTRLVPDPRQIGLDLPLFAGQVAGAATGTVDPSRVQQLVADYATPTTVGTFSSATVTVTDAIGANISKAFSITINPALVITAPGSLPDWTAGFSYPSTTPTATGGTGAKTWSAPGLPAGLTINPATGVVSGTPTTASTAFFSITVTDSIGATGSASYSVTINPAITISPASLPAWTVNRGYPTTAITSAGGTGSRTLGVTGLPAGLTFVGGNITGTPTATGTFTVTATATDSIGATSVRTYSLVINLNPAVTTGSLPSGSGQERVGRAYGPVTMTVSGGTGPFTWAATGLPSGVTINTTTGVISGTPTVAGAYTVTVTVTDAAGATGTHAAYSVTIKP